MKEYIEIIDNHKCRFNISEYKQQFFGRALILDSCLISEPFDEEILFDTEDEVIGRLKQKIKMFTTNPAYDHPSTDGNGKKLTIGSLCPACGRIITINDNIWSIDS